MTARSTAIFATALACLLAGCADGSLTSGLNTGSVNPQTQTQAAKATDAVCLTLASQIEALNTEGVSDKVSKAAAKKYKLKATDLSKADELNKANTEFQGKCSSYPPRVASTAPVEPVTTGSTTPVKTAAKPPIPAQKSVAAAMAPQDSAQASNTPTSSSAPVQSP
jgi:hypothetical protein